MTDVLATDTITAAAAWLPGYLARHRSADPADIAQAALLAAWTHRAACHADTIAQASAWIRTIAHHAMLAAARRPALASLDAPTPDGRTLAASIPCSRAAAVCRSIDARISLAWIDRRSAGHVAAALAAPTKENRYYHVRRAAAACA